MPGPAAYGRGGMRATVTDANVVPGPARRRQFPGGGTVDKQRPGVIGELARESGMKAIARRPKA